MRYNNDVRNVRKGGSGYGFFEMALEIGADLRKRGGGMAYRFGVA